MASFVVGGLYFLAANSEVGITLRLARQTEAAVLASVENQHDTDAEFVEADLHVWADRNQLSLDDMRVFTRRRNDNECRNPAIRRLVNRSTSNQPGS